jgi:methoxymalonate biosynthesis acyl carrier protein
MTLDDSVVLQQIDTFVRSRFEVAQDDPDFTSDVHLFDYGYIDSFGAQQLIEHLESTYHIKITDQDLVKYRLNTLNEISQFVVGRQAGLR